MSDDYPQMGRESGTAAFPLPRVWRDEGAPPPQIVWGPSQTERRITWEEPLRPQKRRSRLRAEWRR